MLVSVTFESNCPLCQFIRQLVHVQTSSSPNTEHKFYPYVKKWIILNESGKTSSPHGDDFFGGSSVVVIGQM
jgi:hypothetical protein